MIVGPHIFAGSPVNRSNIARTFFASSRRCGMGRASMKSSTETSVALVLISAICRPPLVAAVDPAHRMGSVQRRDRGNHRVAAATIDDSLGEVVLRIVEGGAGRVMRGQPKDDRWLPARLGEI